jgi:nucleotide-binding universal stress UspA family protein
VLTVGPVPGLVPENASFKRILCAIDFSDCSMAAWRYATRLVEGSDASIALVHVVEALPVAYDPLMIPIDLYTYQKEAEAAALEQLRKVVNESVPKLGKVEEIVLSGKPYREILRVATERDIDLIVLGIHGLNPIDRMLFGSTAEPIVRRATCPVLTVRPRSEAASA